MKFRKKDGTMESIWQLKAHVESDFPDFPHIDVRAANFDIQQYINTLRKMVLAMGIPLGDIAITWQDLTSTVPIEPADTSIKTVVSACTGVASATKHGFAKVTHPGHHDDDADTAPTHADILSDVSGFVEAGTMCLVLGRSGSGSSLLLSRVAGRDLGSIVESHGQVLYNGLPKLHGIVSPNHFIHFVGQYDEHIPPLTVKHTLDFAASCKWPDWLPHVEAIRKNDVILTGRALGIERTFDTIVGSDILRGISGGERKRVTIAEMGIGMLGGCLVMDNWSKGLDSSTTLSITGSMRELANFLRMAIITSMQAPGIDSFNLFDNVIVLDKGHVIYFGPRDAAESWFTSLGFRRPPQRSVPDFIATVTDPTLRLEYLPADVDVSSLEVAPPTTAAEFAARFAASDIAKTMNMRREKLMSTVERLDEDIPQTMAEIVEQTSLQAPRHQIKAMGRRQIRWYGSIRNAILADLAQNLILGVILGSIFWQLPDTEGGAGSRSGLIFLAMLFIGLSAISKIDQKFEEKAVFAKQRTASFYNAWTYLLSLSFFDLAYELVKSICFLVPLYLMAGLNLGDSAVRLLYAVLIVAILSNIMIAMTRFFVALFDDRNAAQGFAGIMTMIFVLFSGFLKNGQDLEGYLIWIYWMNPLHYVYEALAVNEYDGLTFSCTPEELIPPNPNIPEEFRFCSVDTGENYLVNNLGITIDEIFRLYYFLVLLGYLVLFLVLSAVATARVKPTGHALKALIDAKTTVKSGIEEELSTVIDVTNLSIAKDPHTRFTFEGIKYSVSDGAKVLLDGITGSTQGGSVVLLMGESGAGKSTLLDVCSMRKTLGKGTAMEGTIHVNGQVVDKEELSHLSGYCEQNDLHVGEATVHEAVSFSAKLRLPASMSATEKNNKVMDTIETLGLSIYSDVLVKTLGAGELKLLTMALEVVADPKILFLDEPTSGISASNALVVANALRRIANTGTSVICTVHQPSGEVFAKFDRLLLLKRGGKQVYFGDIGDYGATIRNYFESRGGAKMKEGANPADWMLDVVADERIDWAAEWANSEEKTLVEEEVAQLAEGSSGDPGKDEKSFDQVSFGKQLVEVIRRLFWRYWRLPEYNLTRVILVTVVAVLVGLLYLRDITNTQQGASLAFAALFLSIVPSSLVSQNVIAPTVEGRAVFYRETSAGTYKPLAFHVALGLVEMPFMFVATTAFIVVFYFMVGLDPSRFGYFFLAAQLLYLFAVMLGIMFSSITPGVALAGNLVTSIVSVFNVLTGFFITKPRIPSWWRWFLWVNPFAYYLSGVIQNEMDGKEFFCEPDELGFFRLPDTFSSCVEIPPLGTFGDAQNGMCSFCPVPDGETLIRMFDADEVNKWVSLAALVVSIAFCRVVAGFGFSKLRFLSR